jgi:hypothetical protein
MTYNIVCETTSTTCIFIHSQEKERDKMVEREREAKEERGSISYSFPFFFKI